MIIHDLKCWPEYFEKIADGSKTFDLRQETLDRLPRNRANVFDTGDVLVFREFRPKDAYTGRVIIREVSYVLSHAIGGLMEGFVVLGLKAPPWEILVEK